MAITPTFTATQLLGNPKTIVVTDTSAGSDGNIASRRVYLRDAYNNDVLPVGTTTDYVAWAYSNSSINIDVLTKDMALLITVQWLNASNVVLYDAVAAIGFTSFNEDYLFQLSGYLASNYKRAGDNNFFDNLFLLRTFVDSGNQAIQRGADILKAQVCYDLATEIRVNGRYLFNVV